MHKNTRLKHRSGKGRIGFILTGIVSLLWFLIRVVPRPSRMAYPCQRAAAPVSAAFLVWLSGLVGAHVLMRKWIAAFRRTRSLAPVLMLILMACVLFGLFVFQPARPVRAGIAETFVPIDPPNQPMGTPGGIFPGRVVWMHDPAAVSWDGVHGHWWDGPNIDTERVRAMLSRSIQNLAGESTDSSAWDALFRYFNRNRRNMDSGYHIGETIAIKLNLVLNDAHFSENNMPYPAPQLVHALLRQLVNTAGVPQPNIVLYDATSKIPMNIFTLCKADFPDVRFVDWEGGDGREKYVRDTSVQVHWSQQLTLEAKGGNPAYLVSCLTHADYVINLGNLKGHDLAGITLCAKNHFGSLSADYQGQPHQQAPQAAGVHPYISVHDIDFGDPDWIFSGRAMNTYTPLVDLMGHEHAGLKTLLFLVDGLYAAQSQTGEIDDTQRWQSAPFNGHWTASLFASQDGVALESVCLDLMRNEPAMTRVYGNVDNYLHEAALADQPPSGTFYDPEGDGTGLASLGVHEHWNNAADRQYSGNLGTGAGIELLENPGPFVKQFQLTVVSEYGSVTGPGTYTEGSNVGVSITSTVMDLEPGVRAVFSGWTGTGEGAYTGSDSVFHVILHQDIYETAVWKTEVFLALSALPGSGGTVQPPPPGTWVETDTPVQISATPATGYTWSGWTGDTTGVGTVLELTPQHPMSIAALFTPDQTGVKAPGNPLSYSLGQNFPNPFNPVTCIEFSIPVSGTVHIEIFDMSGRMIRTLLHRDQVPGTCRIAWNGLDEGGNSAASGTYVIRMQCGDFRQERKALLIR
ncbi:DUF362 domain-containing protein [bacterium]|nr:DUF362 domain-containing protein [bacterium]